MKVIVTVTPSSTLIEEENIGWRGIDEGVDIKVRKYPPNYEPLTSSKWYELIVEVDDYSEDDIKKYFTKEDLTAWKEEQMLCKDCYPYEEEA